MKQMIVILAVWNVITFALMGIDKSKAKRNKRRISERTLLTSAFFMGAAGSILGAIVFHHKTRKTKFRILLPTAAIINILVIITVMYFLKNAA